MIYSQIIPSLISKLNRDEKIFIIKLLVSPLINIETTLDYEARRERWIWQSSTFRATWVKGFAEGYAETQVAAGDTSYDECYRDGIVLGWRKAILTAAIDAYDAPNNKQLKQLDMIESAYDLAKLSDRMLTVANWDQLLVDHRLDHI